MKGLTGFIAIIFIIALIAKVIFCCESGSQQSDSTQVKNIDKCLDNSKNFINFVV